MPNGFRVGRIFGIDIKIDPSWIFIFLLITASLTFGFFPAVHPEWGFGLSIVIGVSASILFFASVLAHELAHSLVAKSRGISIKSITLFIFGGVSDIEREPSSPPEEFLIAIVGPLTSVILGVIFLLLGIAAGSPFADALNPTSNLSRFGPLATLLFWLGTINIFLGVFNLVPGFPLDGGRVFRSIVWFFTGSLLRASRIASITGQVIAWLFIITGFLMILGISFPILGSGLINGLWLAFIGWFLNNAAASSYQEVVLENALKNVPVADLMRTNIATVPSDMPVSKLADFIASTKEQFFPAVEKGKLTGVVGVEDVEKIPSELWSTKKVSEIMKPVSELPVAGPREEAVKVFRKIAGQNADQILVVEDGRLVGVLGQGEIATWLKLHRKRLGG